MIILGIDPGTSKRNPTGIAVIDSYGPTLLHTESIGVAGWQNTAGLVFIRCRALAREYAIEAIAYEDSYLDENPQTFKILAAFGGVALAAGAALDVPVIAVQPVEAKQGLTGDHRADKAAMIKMAALVFGVSLSSHRADACGVALAGEAKLRNEVMS